ncbi:MAG: tetratricopeptide repeat protein [Candidatus Thorarchaeota archaeon]
MKLMGTITKYYPFIGEETQRILDTVMAKSSSYFDLVRQLSTTVLEDEVPNDLVYITTTLTWLIREQKLINEITKKYGDLACIRPWKTSSNSLLFTQRNEYQKIKEALDELHNSSISDWMIVEQILNHIVTLQMPLESIRYLSLAEGMISQESNLKCFDPLVQLGYGHFSWFSGNSSNAATHIQRGLELARDYDDAVYEYFGLLLSANFKKQQNYREGLDIFEQAYSIVQNLDVPFFVAEILNDSSTAYEIGGEYDLAISSQIQGMNSFDGDVGIEICYVILSRLYANLGEGHHALEWADRALNMSSYDYGHLVKARALVVLNRLEEAEKFLDIAYRKTLETGYDIPLSRYHLTSGLFEMARGELLAARGSLEQAYDIASQIQGLLTLNEILIALAQVELALLKESESTDEAISGKWLKILEIHARTYDLPGIAIQASMIRSERFQIQGQLKDAHETLQQALKISESPGVNTLRKRISIRISEIKRLMHDEELAS